MAYFLFFLSLMNPQQYFGQKKAFFSIKEDAVLYKRKDSSVQKSKLFFFCFIN